ncbi:MAG: glycosyltransferase family 61 protein [Xanthobacteraceae bacterium]
MTETDSFSHPGEEHFGRALALLDPGEREQYLSLAELIANRPSQFLYELVQFKEALTRRLSISEAFDVFRDLVKFPGGTIENLPIQSLFDVASQHACVFHEIAPKGIGFTAQPSRVMGAGDQRSFDCVTRSLYLTCLPDARVRGRSSFIEFRGTALLDFEGQELERVDDQLILDLPVLQATKNYVWMGASQDKEIELDEALTLLGPKTPQFGHWIWEYMPKYITATTFAEIPNVPILIDAHMPNTHREFLQMVLSGNSKIIEIPYNATVRVRRLWCASAQSYFPFWLKTFDPLWPNYIVAHPDRFAAVAREMLRRMEPALVSRNGPERVFLARKPDQARQLANYAEIEERARQAGFFIVYLQDLSFAEQVRLIRCARHIIGTRGSALFLNFFARPGTRLCILSSLHMLKLTSVTCLFERLGIDTTILTGPTIGEQTPNPNADYVISEDTFQSFLDRWLA